MNQMLLGFIVILFLVSIASSKRQGEKRYNQLCKVAEWVVEEKLGVFHSMSNHLSWILLVAISGYIVIGCIVGQLNSYLLLGGVVVYLINYYVLEYTPHTMWCLLQGGLLSKRQFIAMNWENIVAYRWVTRGEKLILKVDYKGKGIVTRKCELIVPQEMKTFLEEQLKVKVPYFEVILEN